MRTGAAVGGEQFFQARGSGAYAFDAAGRAYVDYLMAYGPLLFGHAHPRLVSGLDAIAARGTVFGSTSDEELRLAQRISHHIPSIEALRFVNTGTEAMMSAVRAARAFTGRSLVVRFAGNYHGHFDGALHAAGASAQTGSGAGAGIPSETRATSIVARYNDLADLDARIGERGMHVAAIVLEPVAANMGLVVPDDAFLSGVFERARRSGALVIFDEVITWLRLGLGGARGPAGERPELTALGKVMGGGFPLAAFGGRADVMAALAPPGAAFTGGTFSGNPFCVALGHRVLDVLESDRSIYRRLDARAAELAAGIRATFAARGVPYAVTQLGSMVDFAFLPGGPVRDYDQRTRSDGRAFAAYYHAMRARGVLLAPSPNEVMFLSTEHGAAEIGATLEAIDRSLVDVQSAGFARTST